MGEEREHAETRGAYLEFASVEVRGRSSTYERLCLAVADSPDVIGLLAALPRRQRQPNLVLAVSRLLGAPIAQPAAYVAWLQERWPEVVASLRVRRTQTNEPGRMATLLPLLSRIDGPLALLEVGASAGLCLYPDRWRYTYLGDRPAALGSPGAPELTCTLESRDAVDLRLPTVVWRAGIDVHPLDVGRAEDRRWLEALVWPEQSERLDRLRRAFVVAGVDRPLLVTGDLNDEILGLAATAPADATLVVFHSAVLAYLSEAERATFVDRVQDLPGHWISNEAPHVVPARRRTPGTPPPGRFLTLLDGEPVAWSAPHGDSLTLL